MARSSLSPALLWMAVFAAILHSHPSRAASPASKASSSKAETKEPQAPTGQSPDVLVVGFLAPASSVHCDPDAARMGRCVEEARLVVPPGTSDVGDVAGFVDPRRSGAQPEKGDPGAFPSTFWRQVGWLYARLWEDLSLRWKEEDGVEALLRTGGVTALPPHDSAWGDVVLPRSDQRKLHLGVPARTLWRGPGQWWEALPADRDPTHGRTGSICAPAAVLCSARYLLDHAYGGQSSAARLAAPPTLVVLRGRFAERLATSKVPHNADIMDGNPIDASPFFEQMDPGSAGQATDSSPEQPVFTEFSVPSILMADKETPVADDERKTALMAWLGPAEADPQAELVPTISGPADLFTETQRHFARFRNTLGAQVLRFARESYAPVHIRVFTALVAMDRPPGYAGVEYRASNVIAAAKGQLDAPVSGLPIGLSNAPGLPVEYNALPLPLVKDEITQIRSTEAASPEERTKESGYAAELAADLTSEYQALVSVASKVPGVDARQRPTTLYQGTPPQSLDVNEITGWALKNAAPGHIDDLTGLALQMALQLLVEKNTSTKSIYENQLILAHLTDEVEATFPANDDTVTIGSLETAAMASWERVMKAHGQTIQRRTGGTGEVNPLAICTTRDRQEALEEPSFHKVNLDLVIRTQRPLPQDPGAVRAFLWEEREQLPFQLVDDPVQTQATVENLVALPGGAAVVRIRWQLWSGWHTLWTSAPLIADDERILREGLIAASAPERGRPGVAPINGGPFHRADPLRPPERLVLRIAPICADTTLASPELVPTLLRASLLGNALWPSTPDAVPGEKGISSAPVPQGDEDQVQQTIASTGAAEDAGGSAVEEAQGAQEDAAGAVSQATELATSGHLPGHRDGGPDRWTPDECDHAAGVAWLRCALRAALDSLAPPGRGLLLVVADSTSARPDRPTRELRGDAEAKLLVSEHRLRNRDTPARTPYVRRVRRLGHGQRMQVASWAFFVERPPDKAAGWTQVWPDLVPNGAVATQSPKARWHRKGGIDWNLSGGLGGFPLRIGYYSCNGDAERADLISCASGNSPNYVNGSSGLSLDMGAGMTAWLPSRGRWAIDVGPELRFDMVPPGGGDLWNADLMPQDAGHSALFNATPEASPDFPLVPSPQGGLVVGVRFAPAAGTGLLTWRRAKTTANGKRWYPWGEHQPDGSDRVGRFQFGLRSGFLLGYDFTALSGNALGELWGAWSRWRPSSPAASLTPYHPSTLIGPFLRVQYSWYLNPSRVDSYYQSDGNWTFILGARGQIRLGQRASLPEGK